jgi:S-adenosylmethionine:tRNA ribosyltransferase-isomerase
MQQQGKVWWKCLVGGFSKWKPGQILQKEIGSGENKLILRAGYIQKLLDCFVIEFSWEPESRSFAEVLHLTGVIPLPPYLKREAEEVDRLRYQTIYARHEGSVAAPTAGLHFTDSLFDKLSAKNIRNLFVSLHVGAGTFKPVNSKTIGEHHMHAENIAVSGSVISDLLQNSRGPVIAVGTTSLRTIESLYWLGIKTILDPAITGHDLVINQWDPYVLQINPISVKEALSSLLQWLKKNQLQELITKTQLLIVPGYEFKITRTLITNFHQPQSTLLLLVAALIGDDWKKVYSYALHNNFRFLSYGDGCLLFGGRN